MNIISAILSHLLKIVKWASTILIVLTMLLIFKIYMGASMESTAGFQKLNEITAYIDSYFIGYIQQLVPTKFYGRDWSYVILIILLMIFNSILYRIIDALDFDRRKKELNYQEFRKTINTKGSGATKEQVAELDKKFSDLSHAKKPKDRNSLLKEFVELKNKLNTMGQECAFLSVDVVDSTGMKRDEDKLIATHDFNRYNDMAQECLNNHGVIKYTTTPDGIMSCFRTVDDAVKCAVDLIQRIKTFNTTEKQIKKDFQIRCGINSGFVYIEDLPLEQVTDHVIDVAGHMQKNAKPNTINIAGSAIEPLKTRGGFKETTDVIDEQRVYVWHENHMEALQIPPEEDKS